MNIFVQRRKLTRCWRDFLFVYTTGQLIPAKTVVRMNFMSRLLLTMLLLALPFLLKARTDVTDSMNTSSFWENIDFRSDEGYGNLTLPPDASSVMVVASNRKIQRDKVRFMSEERSGEGLNYFVVFLRNDRWHVWQTSLDRAINSVGNIDDDWVIYTEGYGKIFTTGLYRGLSMASQHRLNVLYLDYPSYSTTLGMLGNYKFALNNAKQAGSDFAPLFASLKGYREEGKMGKGRLTMFFHSMGNNSIREMVQNNLLTAVNNQKWVDNLVLNSACVPEKNHAEWVDRIHFAKRIYINYNPQDYTLAGAKLVSLTRQLGEGVRGNLSKQAFYVNFNHLCGRNHSNFIRLLSHYRTPSMAIAYYKVLLHGQKVNLKDEESFVVSEYRGLGYSIIHRKKTVSAAPERTALPDAGASILFH